jgi:hypothetical protein
MDMTPAAIVKPPSLFGKASDLVVPIGLTASAKAKNTTMIFLLFANILFSLFVDLAESTFRAHDPEITDLTKATSFTGYSFSLLWFN